MSGADPSAVSEARPTRRHRTAVGAALGVAVLVVGGGLLAVQLEHDGMHGIAASPFTPSSTASGTGAAAALPVGASAMPVMVIAPEPAAAVRALELPGESAAFEEAILYARVDGYVRDRLADIGDRVAADQTLALIDAPELAHQFDQAQAQARQAEANLRLARVTLQRAEQLVRQGHVSRQVFDEREAELGVREADLAAARAEAARLQQMLDFRRVAAPFAGVVVARNVDKGDLVEADAPEPGRYLYRVARLDILRVVVDIPQSEVGDIRVGTPAEVHFTEFPQAELRGAVVRTAGALDPASRSMRVEMHLPNPQDLPAGMIGRVTFTPASSPGLLTVPINALVTRTDGAFIAVVSPASTVRFVPVDVRRNLGTRIEIAGGLAADDRVIVNPNGLLRDNDPIVVRP